MKKLSGCFTAIITPMKKNQDIDYAALRKLSEFQVEQGVKGILAVGTTGESPTLKWNEHIKVIGEVNSVSGRNCTVIGGTGSNSTEETIRATRETADLGVKYVLLVDPYYNGPSSIEIRREYVEPVALAFPELEMIPYIIPGRTGTQLLPQDLAILSSNFENINAVKEATGDLENMKLSRKLCGEEFSILSGDDDKTYIMMTEPQIQASGVISVASNIAPGTVQQLVDYTLKGKENESHGLLETLRPLFSMVTVKTEEQTNFGKSLCKARNPLPFKTLMNILGMPAGPCRQPLGKMTKKGLKVVLDTARETYEKSPEILQPIEDFFDVDLERRLYNKKTWETLHYD
jgi:4-hydroxy-tetrahydrodipicolinate synthase